MLSRPAFRALCAAMCAGLAAGFAVNANLQEFFGGSGRVGIAAFSPLAAGFGDDRLGSFAVPLLCLAALFAAASVLVGRNRAALVPAAG